MSDVPTFDLTLTSLAYGGDAIGRLPDGRAVFVPFALPGERVRVRLAEEKRGHARAELVEVLEPSPQRIAPLCIHFGVCGGCHYQHMPYEAQLAAKAGILREQLERIGGLAGPPVQPGVPSPNPYYYRNHVEFHLTPQGRLGFYKARSSEVFAVQVCHLPEGMINTVWPQLEFEPVSELERIGLRLGAGDDIQLILESNDPLPPEFTDEDLPLSAVYLSPAGSLVLAGSEQVTIEVWERPFRVSAGSFFQVNTPMAEAMVRHLLDNLTLDPGTTVLDVYCGVGLFSAFLAPRVGRVIGIESSHPAVEDFAFNLDEFDNVEIYEAAAEEVLPGFEAHPDVIVLDPPRTGVDRRVLDAILASKASTLAYISCDPATLARDARRLATGGYRLEQVTPFDLFPQTFHIESISFWKLK
ncbi:MAG TPA: class I SAM-dependent RNA methyltransferase [Anaerolineales bacterium]